MLQHTPWHENAPGCGWGNPGRGPADLLPAYMDEGGVIPLMRI